MIQEISSMIEKARTIDEKRIYYNPNAPIDKNFLKEWRNVRTLLNDTYFEEMIKIKKMSQDEFAFALQPLNQDKHIEEDEWLEEFINVLDEFSYDNIDHSIAISIPTLPFIHALNKQLQNYAVQLHNVTLEVNIVLSFIEAAQTEMFNIMGKLIAIELEIYKQSNTFSSEDREERFQEFIKNQFNSKDDFLRFYKKYPVATRVAISRIRYFKNNFITLFSRLEKDHTQVCKFLQIEKLHLLKIELSTGDSHAQGNTVIILHFKKARLVYKPRDLKISESFQAFINWYTKQSETLLDLRIPRGIYYDDYSYVEFIEKTYCDSEEKVNNFYIRYGYLISICYLLGINDLHLENVIAMGDHPVIVDIETMFQLVPEFENENLHTYLSKMLELESVLNSCLLPRQIDVGIQGQQVELSALNGKEAKTSTQVFGPVNINTDEFRYEKQDSYFKGGDNIPMISENEEVDYKQYRLRIIEGFNDFMRFVMKNKEEFIKQISTFKGKKIRVLTKGTERYSSMIHYANHPAYNTEMKYRERLMMNVWAYPYADKRIVESEIEDMIFNDIPIFFTFTNSTSIIDSRGKIYENYFEKSGFDVAVERIFSLDEKEINKQKMIMITSLGLANDALNKEVQLTKIQEIKHHFNYLKEAMHIADKLIQQIIIKEKEASFMNIEGDENNQWKITSSNESFYGGLSGVATFFLVLFKKTKNEEYLKYYQKLLQLSITQAARLPFQSAFTGHLSPIYPMVLEKELLGTAFDPKYISSVIENLNNLSKEDIGNISETDYISGLLGIVRLIERMKVFSEIASISKEITGLFIQESKARIINQKDESVNQIGLAHGLSGLALSLSTLEEKDTELITELLEKEMKLPMNENNYYKWCWGFSGMIQARIAIMRECPDIEIDEQLNQLIKKYENSLDYLPQDDTLCHGTGSILITLCTLFEYCNDKKWKERIHLLLSNIKHYSIVTDYNVPRLFDVEMKGLFDGISGVGFSYLYALGTLTCFY